MLPKKTTETTEKQDIEQIEVKCIADAMLDKKGQNVCSLNLKSIGTSICDYFIVCNAESRPQVQAIADNIEEEMLVKCKRKVARQQGRENAFWIIMDYGNIVGLLVEAIKEMDGKKSKKTKGLLES